MPITKRTPVHAQPSRDSLKDCIDYVLDFENDFKKAIPNHYNLDTSIKSIYEYIVQDFKRPLISTQNCELFTAVHEMRSTQKKFGTDKDNLVAYHTIQSFSWDDPVTPEEVHEMGKQLAKEMYPNFQCVISTHCDRGHLHNHIVTNATSLNGRKLRDDFYNSDTSMMKLRNVSDSIAKEYHCKIIEDAPLFGTGKSSLKQQYLKSLVPSQTRQIKNDIDELKLTCSSFDELLYLLSLKGYLIKKGKHISIRKYESKKYRRLDSVGQGYSVKELQSYFKNKDQKYIGEKEIDANFIKPNTQLGYQFQNIQTELKYSILYSQRTVQVQNISVNIRYKTAQQKSMDRIKKISESIELLNKYGITNYYELDLLIQKKKKKKEIIELELEKRREQIRKKNGDEVLYKTFLRFYNTYTTEKELQEMNPNATLSPTSELFLQVSRELNNPSIYEVRDQYDKLTKEKNNLIQDYAKYSYDMYELTKLDEYRWEQLLNVESFIPSFEFSTNMIHDIPPYIVEDTFQKKFVRLPYTEMYILLNENAIRWKNHQRAQYYTVPNDPYIVYDKNGTILKEVEGCDLAEIVNEQKKAITALYAEKNKIDRKEQNQYFNNIHNYELQNTSYFSASKNAFDHSKETETSYYLKNTTSNDLIEIPKENVNWDENQNHCKILMNDNMLVKQIKAGECIQYVPFKECKNDETYEKENNMYRE